MLALCVIQLLGIVPLLEGLNLEGKPFIINGYDVDIADHPWMGSYQQFGKHNCGLVLVHPQWAVTAAHCRGTPSIAGAIFGVNKIADCKPVPITSITKVTVPQWLAIIPCCTLGIKHPLYMTGDGNSPNDIIVIRLENPVFGENIKPIAIGVKRLNGGEKGFITGWGRTCGHPNCPRALHLQGRETEVLSDPEGKKMWFRWVNSAMQIVIHDKTKVSGACKGDSGGPLVVDGELHGIASWCGPNCDTQKGCVYSRVSYFAKYICDVTGGEAYGCENL